MRDLELVVFDMAGTTIEDRGQVPEAFTSALAMHGIALTSAQVRSVRGASKRQAIRQLIGAGPDHAQRVEEVYASFCAALARRYADGGVRPIAGAVPAFRSLRAQGVKVALNTGFDRGTTDLLLGALGWDTKLVDAVICGDDVAEGRPMPYLIYRAMEATGTSAARAVANVGDTALDLQAGHNAAVRWNIGVLSGAHDRQILERAPHTHLLPSVAELLTVLSVSDTSPAPAR